MRCTTALGRTLRSAETSWLPEPAGDRRRPLSRTRVRCAPRPRRPMVLAAWPPSDRKPRKLPLICEVPEVTVADCRVSAGERVPARTWSSRVRMSTFCGVLKLSRRMREPVTTIVPSDTASPSALVSSPDGGIASPSAVSAGVSSTGVAAWPKAGDAARAAIETVDRTKLVNRRMVIPLSRLFGMGGVWPRSSKKKTDYETAPGFSRSLLH